MSDEWDKLTPYKHVRLRAEMYFGSRDPHSQPVMDYGSDGAFVTEETWVQALFTAFRELFDNALDEVVTHGNGDQIDIVYDEQTHTISVQDNGRGIPIEWSDRFQDYAATVLLSEVNSGRNFIENRGQTRGLNGVGAKGVNFTSELFIAEIQRDKKLFTQNFFESDEIGKNDPVIVPSKSKNTGTKITAKLSPKVFHNLVLPAKFLRARVFEAALCHPKLKLTFNGKKITTQPIEKLFPTKPIAFCIEEENFKSRFWLVPNFMPSESEMTYSLVNTIPMFKLGTHIDAFKSGFFTGLKNALEKECKKRKLQPNRSDMADGLLIYNITDMDEPVFDGQAKTRLVNEPVMAIIRKRLDDPEFFKKIIKSNPEWIDEIFQRCADRTHKKDSSELNRLAKKTARTKIEDLEDACGSNRSKCILFIAEGKSAISGMVDARNPDIHGGLPLRGKILNVFGKNNKKVWDTLILRKIMQAIGLVPGQPVNRLNLRYGKVYITTDADEDGKNICALLVNFFYTMWPELFDPKEEPFIYVFDTPLIVATKGKQRKYWYNENYADFSPDNMKGWEITRAKGLAALKREDWIYALENPKTLPILDDGSLQDALSLLFDNKKADGRKEWIGM